MENNKKSLLGLNRGKEIIVGEGPISNDNIAGLETQPMGHIDFMGLSISHIDQAGNIAG